MKLAWFALLCVAGCTQPSSVSTSSGGETTTRPPALGTPVAGTPESSSNDETETAGALGDPPPTDSNEPAHDSDTPAANTSSTEPAVETTTTPPTPPTVRPTTILAPARSGRVRLPAVHDVIREHRPEVTRCYQEGLSRNRSLSGVAKVRFLIGPRGRIENAEVYESSLHDETVEQCILSAMREWRFPRPRPRGSSVLMTYPYSLATE
ncbi:MAG: TonB family protein [Polyangiales bacterium]